MSNSLVINGNNLTLADATVKRLVHEVLQMDRQFPDEPDLDPAGCIDWLKQMRGVITFCDRAAEGLVYATAVDLALIYKRWPSLPYKFREAYRDDFYIYASKQTGKARGTIENHIRAVETFFFNGVRPTGKVTIPLRDEDKKIMLDDDKNPLTQEVDFDSFSVPIGKMILLRSKAQAGVMNKKDWEMLCDPGVSWDQLNMYLQNGPVSGQGDEPVKGIVYRLEGPYLTATEYNQTVTIAEIQWDEFFNDEDSLERRSINRLLLILGISLGEDDKILVAREKKLGEVERDLYSELDED